MKDRKLALRYATALLDALPDPNQKEAADRFLTALARSMDESRELRDMLLDPAVPRTSRKGVLAAMAGRHEMPQQIENFLSAIVDRGRERQIGVIAAVYHELREQAAGVVPATLSTATPLDEQQRGRATRALEKLTGKRISLSCEVRPELLGGAVASIGSMVYDGSLRSQLTGLRRRLAEE